LSHRKSCHKRAFNSFILHSTFFHFDQFITKIFIKLANI